MKLLKVQLGRAKSANTRLAHYASTIDDEQTLEDFEVRLSKLEECWNDFHSVMDNIESKSDINDTGVNETEIVDFENKYFNTKKILLKAIKNCTHKFQAESPLAGNTQQLLDSQNKFLETISGSCLSGVSPEHQLPKISIKPFSGDYGDWKSFHDLYVSSVHNNTRLTSSQKFHYLKSFLLNEPATLLKHIAITDDNYMEAWAKLISRYNKPGRIAHSFVSKLLQLPSISQPTANNLRPFADSVDEILRGLRALGSKAENRDLWLIHILLNKLDDNTQQLWSESILSWTDSKDKEFPSIEAFITFLEHRCSSLETHHKLSKPKVNTRSQSNPIKNFHISNSVCPKCKSNHSLSSCSQFINLNFNDRRSFVHSQSLCLNCLRPGHKESTCKSTFNCRRCQKRHHTLIHPISFNSSNQHSHNGKDNVGNSVIRNERHQQDKLLPNSINSLNSVADMGPRSVPSHSHVVNHHTTQTTTQRSVTVLPTALAHLIDAFGQPQVCRILLDSGSQVSFISEACVKRLGLTRKHARIPVSGLASTEAGVTHGVISITLHSRINEQSIQLNAYVLKSITTALPSCTFNIDKLQNHQSLNLADPNFNISSPIDILAGADQFFKILQTQSIPGVNGSPDAFLTIFGWVIGGDISNLVSYSNNENSLSHTVLSLHTQLDIDQALQRFWEIEEIQSTSQLTPDEQRTEDHFASTHARASDGKYVVELPFKADKMIDYGNSLGAAIRRQEAMERRFKTNPQLHRTYEQFMSEYLSMGHMSELQSPQASTSECYYLPHHAVFKADSTTTKLRVVFDGSSKHGIKSSLNENLLVGPPIQRELFSTCIRFRRHQYALTGDIEKMFRQIWVSEKHRTFQRIVWRSSSSEPLQHFQLNTVTYGTSCAPYLSVRVLRQLALDNMNNFPQIAKILLNDFYVDDVMTGADTVDKLMELKAQLSAVLQTAGLPLRKWSTNCWPVLVSIPEGQRELSPLDFNDDTAIKVLGLRWYPARDCFSYRVSLPQHASFTKRNILSDASRIFDPLGFLAPSIILIKILFQQLWLLNLQWDDPVPDDVTNRWNILRNEVLQFEKVSITRRIWQSASDIQFHAFSDASEKAFSAVIYCRSSLHGQIHVELIASKTKVAPLKQISIPRLELCGAVLLCNLISKIKLSLQLETMDVYAWTDSQIVLHWLSSPPRRWSTFIGNRTSQILTALPRNRWNHVKSASNPADCASRGLLPSTLIDFDLWWHGPNWLRQSPESWQFNRTTELIISSSELEERAPQHFHILATNDSHFLPQLLERKSSWTKIIRSMAYVYRFVTNLRYQHMNRQFGVLRASEIDAAKIYIIKHIQGNSFASDINILAQRKQLPKSSNLLPLSPFLDSSGVLRVGGRIDQSTLSYAARHPIILPKANRLTFLIAHQCHNQHLHAGVSHMFFLLRQNYWVLGCRTLIRKIVHDCVVCFKQRKSANQQLMAELPKNRITYSIPFSRTGCDYAGPISLRLSRGRNPKFTKGYIALFVCFVTKALHLELVGDLSTAAFLAALHRFVARRGKPIEIISDNGTNFIGAGRQLNEMYQQVLSEQHQTLVADHLTQDGISWKNIPPHSPHHGGLWEAGVRSVKLHLRRIIGNHILTYEEMYTLLTRVEALLNSRPLCPSSDAEIDALTPAHFLIGQPYTAVPEPDVSNIKILPMKNWELLTNLSQGFWNRWHKEYLTSLQQRPKWHHTETDLKPDDIVLVKEPRLPPSKWIIGRIEQCHPGPDGHIRVATVKTSSGVYTRPITKLVPLPCPERTRSFSGCQDVLE